MGGAGFAASRLSVGAGWDHISFGMANPPVRPKVRAPLDKNYEVQQIA